MDIVEFLVSRGKENYFDASITETDEGFAIAFVKPVFIHNSQNAIVEQRDYKVSGEIWQVHKSDADPFPSKPHAHCIGGRVAYVGCKLHLGTRQLYRGPNPLDRYLHQKQFMRLIELIRPKFPEIELPLS